MIIGVPRETEPGERRVALVPDALGDAIRCASRGWFTPVLTLQALRFGAAREAGPA